MFSRPKPNYTEIQILGETVGLRFGIQATAQVCQMEKTVPFYFESLVDGKKVQNFNEVAVAHILYAGYCNNCYSLNETPYYDFQTVYDTVEDILFEGKAAEILLPIIECYKAAVDHQRESSK